MANGHPKFGGTNGVELLDIGQEGGVRAGVMDARLTGRIERGVETIAESQQQFPQQAIVIQDNLGFTGVTHRLVGILRASTMEEFHTMLAELDQRRTGQLRFEGLLETFDPAMIRETLLTDFDETIIATQAVLAGWRLTGRIQKGGPWFHSRIEILFRGLA